MMSHRTRLDMFFLTVVIVVLHANNAHTLEFGRVKGETQYNYLRHSVAISNSEDTYGKHGSTLLGRQVVSRHRIWTTIDDFTKNIFSSPEKLDWYVADVATDGDPRAVTLNAGFSCIDLGQSNSAPLSWWVARDLSIETSPEAKVGGINRYLGGTDGSFNDILERCWEGRKVAEFAPRRLVEHHEQHRGTGVKMIKPEGNKDKPESVVDDNSVFDRLFRLRKDKDRSDVVIYDKSGIGVVVGLTFESGFRIHAPAEMTTEKTREFRVPMTPLGGITTHIGARLSETRVDRSESRTSNLLLLLTVWASGLAVLLAVWIMCKTISDTLISRSETMRKADVHSAVQGSDGWGVGEKALLFANFAAVTILLTPIGQAIVEGNIDPRSAIEVHYGASVFYTDSGRTFSEDDDNPIAGSIFFVSSWITVRPLDDGFVAALTFSLTVILFFAVVIAMRVTKKSSEMMRSSRQRWRGFSLWKLTGYIRMWVRSRPGRNIATYKVFIKLRADAYPLEGGEHLEDRVKEVSLMGHETWRVRANTLHRRRPLRHRDKAIREAAREASHVQLRKLHGSGCIGLFARVNLDDKRRFRAATSRTTAYQDAMDRNWEYIRRGAGCKSIEWYRTNGQYPPDKALVVVRLGLLKYAKFISEVTVAVDTRDCEYDRDGVRCYVAVATPTDKNELMDGTKDIVEGFPRFVELGSDDRQPKLFTRNVTSEGIEIKWLGGTAGKYHLNFPESSMALRYCEVEKSDFSDGGEMDE